VLGGTFFEESVFYALNTLFMKRGNVVDTESEITAVNAICIFVGLVCWVALIAAPLQMAVTI
jgi:hypothetical protein